MVIGGGMVAKAFAAFENEQQVLVFASGVSRSNEVRAEVYQREIDLFEKQDTDLRLVYFSTCALFDPTLSNGPYVKHKLRMEERIRRSFQNHLIVRLPNLVGHTKNPFTLTNFIRDHIVQQETFELHLYAARYIMDVEFVAQDLAPLIRSNERQGTSINVCSDEPIPLPQLVLLMEKILDKKADVIRTDKGHRYSVDNADFMAHLDVRHRHRYALDDLENTLRKYYGCAVRS